MLSKVVATDLAAQTEGLTGEVGSRQQCAPAPVYTFVYGSCMLDHHGTLHHVVR